jgi:hypothetical protein
MYGNITKPKERIICSYLYMPDGPEGEIKEEYLGNNLGIISVQEICIKN